ncbi:cytochrome c oxidase Cu(A) center assembly protein [Bacillus sp. B-jedd]|nr:cytochrome c oxidase Cu(A) center assembly protein [Bacillus sp. B-jedd]
MKIKALLLAMAAVVLVLSACGPKEIKGAKNWPVEDFTFTNQDNKQFGLKDLEGKVWMADFIFTNCETVCPPMTANMAEIQEMAAEEGIKNIEFVSFSVDPEGDTPEALKEYGTKFDADLKNWNFLTGYEQEEIEEFAVKYFKTPVAMPKEGDQVVHGTSFFLVGKDGKIKTYYSGVSNVPYDDIIKDIKTLQ